MNKDKARQLLNKLDPINSQLEEAMKAASKQLKETIGARTTEQVNERFRKLDKSFQAILSAFELLKTNLTERDKGLIEQFRNALVRLSGELNKVQDASSSETNNLTQQIQEIQNRLEEVSSRKFPEIPDFSPMIKSVESSLLEIISAENANRADDYETQKKELEKIVKSVDEKINRLRNQIGSYAQGGGNANRNIAVGGNGSVLSMFTDINLKAGSGVTLSYSNNITTKYLDLTIAATGGGAGITRAINNTSASLTADATPGIDQVYVASAGVKITLPSASLNGNLYTIKNVSTSSVLVARDGSDTIDNDTSLILSTQFTAVDLISDGFSNWNIT